MVLRLLRQPGDSKVPWALRPPVTRGLRFRDSDLLPDHEKAVFVPTKSKSQDVASTGGRRRGASRTVAVEATLVARQTTGALARLRAPGASPPRHARDRLESE